MAFHLAQLLTWLGIALGGGAVYVCALSRDVAAKFVAGDTILLTFFWWFRHSLLLCIESFSILLPSTLVLSWQRSQMLTSCTTLTRVIVTSSSGACTRSMVS